MKQEDLEALRRDLNESIDTWRKHRDQLSELSRNAKMLQKLLFPVDSVVRRVRDGEQAIVVSCESRTSPDEVWVMFQNGNIWAYKIDNLEPVSDRSVWHPWVVREMEDSK